MAERRLEAVVHGHVRDPFPVALDNPAERGGFAEKGRDEGGARAVVQRLWRTDLQHPAAFHDDQPIRHGQRLFLVVGHVDGGDTHLFLELLQLHAHHVPQPLVEIRERLVEQQDVGLVCDDPRESHALALPPESWAGYRSPRSESSTRSSTSPTRARRSEAGSLRILRPYSTFRVTVMWGNRA